MFAQLRPLPFGSTTGKDADAMRATSSSLHGVRHWPTVGVGGRSVNIMKPSGLLYLVFSTLRASLVVLVVKNPPANAGDLSSIPGSGRSPGGGNDNPL